MVDFDNLVVRDFQITLGRDFDLMSSKKQNQMIKCLFLWLFAREDSLAIAALYSIEKSLDFSIVLDASAMDSRSSFDFTSEILLTS